MNILTQLEQPPFHTSKADRKILTYMRGHPEEVPLMTIATLAKKVDIAESTVTRFVKKMGYANLHLFKVLFAKEFSLHKEKQILRHNIAKDESALLTGRKLLHAYYETLDHTLAGLPAGIIERCAIQLQQAVHIFFVGLGNSGFMALDAAYKFFRIGLMSTGFDNSHTMAMQATLSTAQDAFVAVSHSGETPEIIKTLRLAKENSACVIAITAGRSSTLAKLADEVVPYVGKETLLETGSVSVKMAQIFILDLIYTQIVKERAEQATECKRKTALAIHQLR